TADRIVARMAIYSPEVPSENEPVPAKTEAQPANAKDQGKPDAEEHDFDITGSYFENLRIAGYPINVQFATDHLLEYQKYGALANAIKNPEAAKKALLEKKAQLAQKVQAAETVQGTKKNQGAKDNAAEEEVYDVRELQPWGNLNKYRMDELESSEKDYHA